MSYMASFITENILLLYAPYIKTPSSMNRWRCFYVYAFGSGSGEAKCKNLQN